MSTEAEALAILAAASDAAGGIRGAAVVTSWLGPLLRLGARMASAGLTPEHITRIDVTRLRELLADADSRLDARAERHDRGVPPSDRTPDRRATMPVDTETGFGVPSPFAWHGLPTHCAQCGQRLHDGSAVSYFDNGDILRGGCHLRCVEAWFARTHDAPASTDRAPSVYPEEP